PSLLRSLEMLRHVTVVVSLLDEEGGVLSDNPIAMRLFGPSTPFADRFVDAGVTPAIVDAARQGQAIRIDAIARTSEGERLHAIEARPTRDPVTGATAILVHQTDETARRGAERDAEEKGRAIVEMERVLEVVEAQRAQILALSAPVLDVGERTLAVPVIGAI